MSMSRRRDIADWTVRVSCLLAGLIVWSSGAAAQDVTDPSDEAPQAFGIDDYSPPSSFKPAVIAPSTLHGVALFSLPETRLGRLDMQAVQAEDALRAAFDKVLRYGIGRDVDVRELNGAWFDAPGVGSLWATDIVAEGAIGQRVHFTDMDLPPGAELYVYAVELPERMAGPYEGRGIHRDGQIWSPSVFGARVRIEYFEPMGRNGGVPAALPFRVDRIQHLYLDPVRRQAEQEQGGNGFEPRGAGPCHNDVTCYPAWANTARACAGIGTINSDALYCSGQMLNAQNNDLTPYWLTANHCLSTQSAASNAEIYWLYQTGACNGAPPSIAGVPQSAVCTLLSTGSSSDYTLLMIEGAIPSGLYWAGWTSASVPDGTASACIHHPSGDFKRISFATKSSNTGCGGANHVRMNWTDGPTEPGSSGSGAFRSDTQQLFGQLHCGPSACGNETNDDYGAFVSTYPNISSLLAGGSDDSLEPNDTCAAARVMTPGTSSGLIVKSTDEDWYRISLNSGQQLTATLTFTHTYGDIDCQLYASCGGPVAASATSATNNETLTYTHTGGAAADYYLRVFLASDTRATYNMTLSTSGGGPVGNDACANATPIGNGSVNGSTSGMTNDGSANCGNSSNTADVWYAYTATCTGTLSVNTCGSGYDTVLSVHSACPGTIGNQLACNDDCSGAGAPCGGLASCLTTSVVQGTTYYIRVSGYNGATGSFTLTTSCSGSSTPANDNCANATVVGDGTTTFSTVGATTDGPNEPNGCNFFSYTQIGNDIWFRYSATCTGDVTVDLCGSLYDTKIGVYSATCPTAPNTVLVCNDDFDCNGNGSTSDDGFVSRVTFPAVAGTQYLLRIGGYNGATGNGTMTISCASSGVPIASFTAAPNPAACNQTVTFNGSGSSHTNPNRQIIAWDWDLDGDGQYDDGSGAIVTRAYPLYGAYTIGLRVTDNGNPPLTDIESLVLNVNLGNQPPIANPGGPYSVAAGGSVTLSGTASSDPNAACGDSIVAYAWDLDNDGQFDDASGVTVNLTWSTMQSLGIATLGPHTIRLRVTDEFNATGTASTALTVVCGGGATGDLNGSGAADGDDVQLFVAALTSGSSNPALVCAGDFSGNSQIDPADVAGFVAALLGP